MNSGSGEAFKAFIRSAYCARCSADSARVDALWQLADAEVQAFSGSLRAEDADNRIQKVLKSKLLPSGTRSRHPSRSPQHRSSDEAWPGAVVEESNLSVQIAALRKALGQAPDGTEWIATVPRVGYRFAHAAAKEDALKPRDDPPRPREPFRKPSIAVLPLTNMRRDRPRVLLRWSD